MSEFCVILQLLDLLVCLSFIFHVDLVNICSVPVVSQCPIASGNSFLYEFTVPDQAGTFWYHSHFCKHSKQENDTTKLTRTLTATQYCDGLRGPFVVYDRDNDPYKDMYDVDNGTCFFLCL